MTIGNITATWTYPVKGMHGIRMNKRGVQADPNLGVLGDRQFAVYRREENLPAAWKPKGQFHVCVNREGMAVDANLTEGDLDENWRLDPQFTKGLVMGRNLSAKSLVDTGGSWHLADTNKPCISFLNLASVREVNKRLGIGLDPRRFRMNVWVEGLEPWVELDYITAFEQGERFPMMVGDVQVYCDDLCERCKAVEQDPETGLFGDNVLQAIEDCLKDRGYGGSPHRNVHRVMGWLAIPQSSGNIKPGQSLTFGTN